MRLKIKHSRDQKMAKTTRKKQKPTQSLQDQPQNLKEKEETVLSILKSLGKQEKELQAEKDQLLDMEATLKKRIKNEIDVKKSRISDLQDEIPEIQLRIETLAKLLEIPVVK
jgi:hypothetical protein